MTEFAWSFYLGFVRQQEEISPHRTQSAFVLFVTLTVIVAYVSVKTVDSEHRLSQVIALYKGDLTAVYTPGVIQGQSQKWIFESQDSVQELQAFYSKPEHLGPWEIKTGFPFMRLTRQNQELLIHVSHVKS